MRMCVRNFKKYCFFPDLILLEISKVLESPVKILLMLTSNIISGLCSYLILCLHFLIFYKHKLRIQKRKKYIFYSIFYFIFILYLSIMDFNIRQVLHLSPCLLFNLSHIVLIFSQQDCLLFPSLTLCTDIYINILTDFPFHYFLALIPPTFPHSQPHSSSCTSSLLFPHICKLL